MQRVSRPSQLPGTEVGLTALLVQISEDEKQQNRDESRDQNRRNDNTVHRAVERHLWPNLLGQFKGGNSALMFSYRAPEHNKI